ncbi:TPM domain-containing protein [Methylobacterium nigriterrae]|uniref:TPM domain-containing protein n=1 Tax=Methylobacterium nigriterrae TaxID=3127512 RepID=UPI003013B8DF
MTGRRGQILGGEARARIAEAVRLAEAGTSGEIVVMVSARAGLYRSVALLAALITSLVLPWPLIWFTDLSAAAIALAQALVVLGVMAATLVEAVRLALVPRRLRRMRARDAARLAFWSRGLSRTQRRTGILIYLALAERHAEIVADDGILSRIGAEHWNATLADLLAALHREDIEAGLIRAVEQVGVILAPDFPPDPNAVDELPNRVIVTD